MSVAIAIPGFAEPFSSISHLLGAVVFVGLGVPLIGAGRGNAAKTVSLSIFVFGCVLLLCMSAAFHLLARGGEARAVLQRLDHAAIFFLIAATFTPIHIMLFTGPMRWGMLAFVWMFAAAGITMKSIYFKDVPEGLGMVLYMTMGWVGLVSMLALGRRHGLAFVSPLVAGGAAYSLGAVADYLGVPVLVPGVIASHEIFHVAVLAGIGFHWTFVRRAACHKASLSERGRMRALRRAPAAPAGKRRSGD